MKLNPRREQITFSSYVRTRLGFEFCLSHSGSSAGGGEPLSSSPTPEPFGLDFSCESSSFGTRQSHTWLFSYIDISLTFLCFQAEASNPQYAANLLMHAVKNNPSASQAYYNLGLLLGKQNPQKRKEAEWAYRAAIQTNPTSDAAYGNLASLLQASAEPLRSCAGSAHSRISTGK